MNEAYGCIEQLVFFLGGVLLGILHGSVPPGSSNSEPILWGKKTNMPFSTPVLASKIHTRFQTWLQGLVHSLPTQ